MAGRFFKERKRWAMVVLYWLVRSAFESLPWGPEFESSDPQRLFFGEPPVLKLFFLAHHEKYGRKCYFGLAAWIRHRLALK